MTRPLPPSRPYLTQRLSCLLALLAVGHGVLFAQGLPSSVSPDDLRPRNWRLMWLRDPATTATLSWNTLAAGAHHVVHVRRVGEVAFKAFPATDGGSFSYAKKNETSLFYHRVTVTQLLPGQRYEVEFESDGGRSPRFYFLTAPAGNTPFTLLFGGDSRSDPEKRIAMNQLMARLVESGAASSDPADQVLALVHAGDYVQSGTNLNQWATWMSNHEHTVTSDGRLLPIIPARGNHDRGRLFCEAFGFDAQDQHNWFGVSFGALLRLVTLNTEASIAGNQAKWLDSELAAARPKYRWLVAQYHRPGYAATKWPSGAIIHWVPKFEKYNVDLVCEGDGHTIKRTVPIRGGQPDPTGIVYVGEGGLGVPPRAPKPDRWYLQAPGMCDSGYHLQRLKFTPDKLTYECVLLSGEIRDRWEKVK